MKIAILGWGSLIWDSQNLNFNTQIDWQSNGPILPIEFARISNNGRLTLVITSNGTNVETLYAISNFNNIEAAIINLSEREGSPKSRIGYYINSKNEFSPTEFGFKDNILEWIQSTDIDAVIWTNLTENWSEKTTDRIEYLNNLDHDKKTIAKIYIVNAPKQIRTDLRNQIEETFNWQT